MPLGVVLLALLPATLAGATRTAMVADLSLSPLVYSHASQTNAGTMVLSVSDDASLGWNVTISASEFVYSGLYSGASIPASSFTLTAADPPTHASGQAIDASGGPKVPVSGATGTLDQARKVLQAEAGYGQGSYSQDLQVALTVPERARAGTYSSTLTVTITAGP